MLKLKLCDSAGSTMSWRNTCPPVKSGLSAGSLGRSLILTTFISSTTHAVGGDFPPTAASLVVALDVDDIGGARRLRLADGVGHVAGGEHPRRGEAHSEAMPAARARRASATGRATSPSTRATAARASRRAGR